MTAFLVAALAVSHVELAWADQTDRLSAQESIVIGGSVTKSTINNTINKQDPAVLAAMAKTFADQIAATTEARAQAEARVADLASKLGFTTSAVTAFFKILGEQKVPEEKVPVRLIEIATHFAQTRTALAALEPDDPQAAELARQAKAAFDSGRLVEADSLLERAKNLEAAALREARQFMQRAQKAVRRHAFNLAEMESTQADIALTQLRYPDAARHYEKAATLLPPNASYTRGVYLGQAGDALQTSGNLAPAFTDYQASHATFERLAKADPGNAGWQHGLSVSHERVGDVQQAQGDLAAALTSYQASLTIRDRLVKADPGNADWHRDLAVSYGRVAVTVAGQGDGHGALSAYHQGREIIVRLSKQSPDNVTLQNDLIWFDRQMGGRRSSQSRKSSRPCENTLGEAVRPLR